MMVIYLGTEYGYALISKVVPIDYQYFYVHGIPEQHGGIQRPLGLL